MAEKEIHSFNKINKSMFNVSSESYMLHDGCH